IDNKVALTGGINIGDEYLHLDKYYGFWRDTHILLEGSAVTDLNLIFLKDWYNSTGEILDTDKFLIKHTVDNKNSLVQIVEDGPDKNFNVIKHSYFKMINEANERVWITTPYLILDVELISALKIAALSGIDVRIIVPGLHDKGKTTIYKATEAYFSELLEAGVKIYKYNKRFIHSKVFIIDDDIASVGTVNFDYRSFELHFEVTVLLYLDNTIKDLIKDYETDLSNSKEVLWEKWKKRNKIQKLIESIVRIFSPLL
ncbi:MAG TPA: cardiolipin synthase, partial [Tenericutes bacterium]|nr:cardiolipin synthase [Mycoplasmatota bacterium]